MNRRWWLLIALAAAAIALVLFFLGRRSKDGPAAAPVVAGSAAALGDGNRLRPDGTERPLPMWFAKAGVPQKRIAGRVTTEGKPVEGAVVTLHSILTKANAVAVVVRRTGADGRFDFGLRPAAAYEVTASAPGLVAAIESVELADPTRKPPADQLELKLKACAVTIAGTIFDSSGGVIAGARVRRNGLVGSDANARGEYKLCLPPGNVELEFSADGYGGVMLGFDARGDMEQDVVLVPEGAISVLVVRASNGQPVEDAFVHVHPKEWGRDRPAPRTGLTNADGRVRITGLTPGGYNVFGGARGLFTETFAEAIAEVGASPEVVLRLVDAARVSGRVMRGDQPVAGAEVNALRKSPVRRATPTTSQLDGSFVLEEVPIGELIFVAHPFTVKSPAVLRVEAGKTYQDVILQVEPLGTIHGLVTRGGKPVPGAEVCCIQGAMGRQNTIAGEDGRYQFRGVEPGRHELLASQGDDAFVLPTKFTLGLGEDKTLDFELDQAGTISGTVVDKEGKPVRGVFVLWMHEKTGDVGRSTTDVQGRYKCGAMTGGGTYRASVAPKPNVQTVFPTADGAPYPAVEVKDGRTVIENVKIAIDLQRLQIAGRVVDTTGAGVADAQVKATVSHGETTQFNSWQKLPSAFTDTEGNFTVSELTVGTYALKARSADGGEGVVANIAAGATGVTVRLQRPAAIEGKLVGFGAQPAIYAVPLGVRGRWTAGVVDGATFRIGGLAPGRYMVNAQTTYEGDAKVVELETGKVAQLTLTSRGRAAIEGTVLDFRTNAPISGAACHVVMASDGVTGVTNWDLSSAAKSDDRGRVVLDPAPAGSVTVECMFSSFRYSMPAADVTVAPGARAAVQLYTVELLVENGGDSGVQLDPHRTTPVIASVRPGSSAAKSGLAPGDVVDAVDGVSVGKLNGNGVDFLIVSHEVGTDIAVTVLRDGARKTFTFQLKQ